MQDDWGTKLRVGSALSLLIGAKVCRVGACLPHDTYGNLGLERRSTLLLQKHC